MELKDWFAKGLTFSEYVEGMSVNKQEMESIENKFSLTEEEEAKLGNVKGKGLKVIVLTEDWCGDAMLNIPILMHIARETDMETRFILRDENLELMDQYLTNGTARSIPIFIFIDGDGQEKAVWGPRAETVQAFVDNERAQLPSADSEDFKEKQGIMFKKMKAAYQEDEQVWHDVAASIIAKLQ
ncbi:hypothetical protein B14911_19225 [Bacillus sp. NRRL B-14911]|uniref:Thioredoxin n=1 Tax=Bacillus infantis NRRL B-14911 TaxID=1367477 RepID=U5L4A1_9BACI|nr:MULTISPECIES: thioredoxin family protein [Bacillus]AGX02334.1 thioredoxin [Bacillus infantis NRRL B-14911]EAR67558.1 hypothetical protein B14911_19225 [Bacillus sp. NRRL B-14911]